MACSLISTLPFLFSKSCIVANTSQNVPVMLALKKCCTATTFSKAQDTTDHCYYYCNITSSLEIRPMHDCLKSFLAEKGVDVASFDIRFIWKPESTGNAESGERIDLRAIIEDPFVIDPDPEVDPGSEGYTGANGDGEGGQGEEGDGDDEGCTTYQETEPGAGCPGEERGQGGNGRTAVSTSATATISSSLSASSVGFNGTSTATVSTTGAGSKFSAGVYTPQASSSVSSEQRENVEWAVGLLVVLASLGSFL